MKHADRRARRALFLSRHDAATKASDGGRSIVRNGSIPRLVPPLPLHAFEVLVTKQDSAGGTAHRVTRRIWPKSRSQLLVQLAVTLLFRSAGRINSMKARQIEPPNPLQPNNLRHRHRRSIAGKNDAKTTATPLSFPAVSSTVRSSGPSNCGPLSAPLDIRESAIMEPSVPEAVAQFQAFCGSSGSRGEACAKQAWERGITSMT